MPEVTNAFLAKMIQSRFAALAKDISATHHRLDMLTASVNDLAAAHVSHGEITAVHGELDRLRQDMTELDARAKLIELQAAAVAVLTEAHLIHETYPWPLKYRAPYRGLVKLGEVLERQGVWPRIEGADELDLRNGG